MVNEPITSPRPTDDRSVTDLVKDITELVPRLVRDEIKLAQLDMTRKGKQAGMGAGMLGGGGLIALYGIGCLIATAVIAISLVLSAWLAALIVGVVLLAVAGIAAKLGSNRLKKATPPVPKQAMSNVQADIQEIKDELHDKGAHDRAVPKPRA